MVSDLDEVQPLRQVLRMETMSLIGITKPDLN